MGNTEKKLILGCKLETKGTKMTDIMVDLETMDNKPTSAIIAIGAVEFDREKLTLGKEFYTAVDLASSMAAGGTVSADTVMWWMRQSDAARNKFKKQGEALLKALSGFKSWIRAFSLCGDIYLWGNGASFDNVILRHAYDCCGMQPPWPWWNERCFRTFKAENPLPEERLPEKGTVHNALDDAKWQAEYMLEVGRG
jgi:exodeoxyribonuclease VIII